MPRSALAIAACLFALATPARAKPTEYEIGTAYWRRASKTRDAHAFFAPPWLTISGHGMSCFKKLPKIGAEVTLLPLNDAKLPLTRQKIIRSQPETDAHERNECPNDVAVDAPVSNERLLVSTPLDDSTVDFLFISPPVAQATLLEKSGRPQPKQLESASAKYASYVDIDGDGKADFCVGSSGETSLVYLQWIGGAWKVLNEVDGD